MSKLILPTTEIKDDDVKTLLSSITDKLNIQNPFFFNTNYFNSGCKDNTVFDSKFKCKQILSKSLDYDTDSDDYESIDESNDDEKDDDEKEDNDDEDKDKEDDVEFTHKGIATRSFTRSFALGEYMEVTGAEFENGMLAVTIERIVPEDKKPKSIKIK